MRLLTPSDVLGVGSSPDDHRERFKTADLRVPIAKDMTSEDNTLRNYLENCRLEHWLEEAKTWAQEKVQREHRSGQDAEEVLKDE